MAADSTCPLYLAVSGRLAGGRAGKEGPALLLPSSALAAAEVEAWLEGRAAAAGSRGCCCAVLAISRMLCSVAVSADMWQTVSDLRRKRQAWKEVARHPPFSHRPAKSDAGGLEEENLLSGCCSRTPLLLLQQNASAVELHHLIFVRLRVSVHV